MSNKRIEQLREVFAEKAGLAENQVSFKVSDDKKKYTLVVEKDGEGQELGALSSIVFLNGEFSTASRVKPAVEMFLDLCAQKLEDDNVEVPELAGNSFEWADCYKNIAIG